MFGQQLRALRRLYRLSQQDIANLVGVSAVAVGKWERGLTTPDLPKLIALADYFRVSLDTLCGRAGWELRGIGSVPLYPGDANEMEPEVYRQGLMQTSGLYEHPQVGLERGVRESAGALWHEDGRPVAQDWQRSARGAQAGGRGSQADGRASQAAGRADAPEFVGMARSAGASPVRSAERAYASQVPEAGGVDDYAGLRPVYAASGRAPAYAKVDPAAPVGRLRQGPEYSMAARAEGPLERETVEDLLGRAGGLFRKR